MGVRQDIDDEAKVEFARQKIAREDALSKLTSADIAWIRRLKKLVKDMPASLHVLAGGQGGLTVFQGVAEYGREVQSIPATRFAARGE